MVRDRTSCRYFTSTDELVVDVYRATRSFPVEERYGLQAQLRCAAVSVATSIVEGCARNSERDYLHFVDMALASASEVRYLLGLSARLGILQNTDQELLVRRYDDLNPQRAEALELAPEPEA